MLKSNQLEQLLAGLQQNIRIISNNQRELARSLDASDSQFCCMLRLFYQKMNECISAVNSCVEDKVSPVTLSSINLIFNEFAVLRQIDNFTQYLNKWYSGTPLQDILDEEKSRVSSQLEEKKQMHQAAVSEESKKELETENASFKEPHEKNPMEHPEGAVIFGGDYVKDQDGSRTEEDNESSSGSDDGLSSVQTENKVVGRSKDGETSAAMS